MITYSNTTILSKKIKDKNVRKLIIFLGCDLKQGQLPLCFSNGNLLNFYQPHKEMFFTKITLLTHRGQQSRKNTGCPIQQGSCHIWLLSLRNVTSPICAVLQV